MRNSLIHGALAALLVVPMISAASEAPDGRQLFQKHCSMCHLEGGTGTFMLGRRLGQENALLEKRTNLNADYVRVVVRNGIVSMPRFSRPELPDAELERIARYLARTGDGQ